LSTNIESLSTNEFWHHDRLRRFANSLLLSLLVSLLLVAVSDRRQTSLLYRGDFPAFYATATLAAEHKYAEVYDAETQHSLQRRFWPSMEGRYYAFSYPPYVIPLLAPLARLSPQLAKLLVTAAMLVLLLVSLRLLRPIMPEFGSVPQAAIAGCLTFAPLFFGLLGQNVGLSLLCLSATAYGLHRGGSKGELLAGAAMGLWLFKPNLSLPLLAVLSLFCGPAFFAGAGMVAAIYLALAVVAIGPEWVTVFKDAVQSFLAQENNVNRFQMIDAWSAYGALSGSSTPIRVGFALLLAGGALYFAYLCVCLLWSARGISTRKANTRSSTNRRVELFLLCVPLAMMISPHVLFYELGWLIPTAVFFFPPRTDLRIWLYIVLDVLASIVVLMREDFSFQPLSVLPLGIFLLALRTQSEGEPASV